jgi:hypothetical protein
MREPAKELGTEDIDVAVDLNVEAVHIEAPESGGDPIESEGEALNLLGI